MNKVINLLIVICSFQLLFSGPLMAQNSVSGVVTDASINEPLIGATVIIKGSINGTITDIDGKFTLNVPSSTDTLVVSYIGYLTKNVAVNGQATINIGLKADTENIDEVVVIGYGTQKKSHLTGSVSKLDTEGLDKLPSPSADQVLQGRVAGVSIQNQTSVVGESPNITIRGNGSISANGQPLVIVDGFPVEDGLSVIDVSDIESMEVLKDAASAAIYGSRAANGVIIVTTKSGQVDKPRYNFKISHGIKNVYQLHDVMTAQEYIDMEIEEAYLSGETQLTSQYFAWHVLAQANEVNWQEEALNDNAQTTNAQLSVSGGKEGVKYYLSVGYLNDEGIMDKNVYERMNVRTKVEAKLSDMVTVGINLAPTYTTRTRPVNNFTDFLRSYSWLPVYHDSITAAITGEEVGSMARGGHFNNKEYTGIDPMTGLERTETATPFNTSNNNPRWHMDNGSYQRDEYRLQGNGFIQIDIIEGLKFKTTNGFNVTYRDTREYNNADAKVMGDAATSEYSNRLFTDFLSENNFMYNKDFGKHGITALLGASVQQRTYKTAEMVGTEFPTDYIHDINAAGSITQVDEEDIVTGTWTEEEALASFYGRLAYAYDNKYLLSASLRADGSSKFGSESRWGYFPSVSLGWNLHQEEFIKNNIPVISQLKLRGSYGVTGTDDIENYANTNTLQSNFYILGSGNGTTTAGLSNTQSVLGNSSLQWEQTNEFNYGLDFGMFAGRVSLGVDYYYSITKSLLYERSLTSVSGFTEVWSNQGKVRNNGVEILLSTVNIAKPNFKWETGINFALNRNMVLDLAGPEYLINSGEIQEQYITRVGDPIIQFYGYEVIGVWETQEQIDNNPSYIGAAPGALRTKDVNGDGQITAADYTVIGSPLPDFTFGVTNTLSYKAFDLSFLIQGVIGGDIINGNTKYNEVKRMDVNFNEGHWVNEDNPGDGVNPVFNGYAGVPINYTSYAVEDASYVSLRNLTLSYTLPKNICEKLKLNGMNVYLSGANLLYFWGDSYRGVNPEARNTSGAYDSPLVDGYQRGAFPIQRTYSIGVEINF